MQITETTNPGAHNLITTHYSSLSFQSKHLEYWNEAFVKDYLNFMMLAGIRGGKIDDFVFDDVKSCCSMELQIHNEESIKNAIKMNLAGKFDKVYEPYEQINRKFLMEIMNGYDAELKKAHKVAIKVRNEMNKPAPLTPEQEAELLKQNILKSFAEYKKTNDLNLISHIEYDYLDKTVGVKLVTDERKKQLMVEAKSHLTMVYAQGSISKGIAQVQKDMSAGTGDEQIIMIAKKLAVRDYYQTIENLNL